MWLKQVTITGVDQFVDYNKLALLSLQYPFVEWGFLLSYPAQVASITHNFVNCELVDKFYTAMLAYNVYPSIALHVCGDAARVLITGIPIADKNYSLDIATILNMPITHYLDRLQLNFSKKALAVDLDSLSSSIQYLRKTNPRLRIIVQHNKYSKELWKSLYRKGIEVDLIEKYIVGSELGSGIESIVESVHGIYCGYSGGARFYDIIEIFKVMQKKGEGIYWVDCDRAVRDEEGRMDVDKVEELLKIAKNYIIPL